ncbi:MAG: hypothetical protein HYV37_03260 [Candidatus Levyibacteriota bacterium]|nr:MAG: hypothetical protein HYV37_03260 [Candidatus Levybacteria bacterium]
MANINAPDIEYFESFVDEIKGKFQRIKTLTSHRVTSGDYHEEILRTIIRNFLTKRYSVKKGFIYKGKGDVSNQIDIMIVDETMPAAYLFQEGDFAIVIPEAVIAILEVKTTLNAGDFDNAVENIASAKRLSKFKVNPFSIIFGYSGTTPSDKNLNKWFKRPSPTKLKEDFVLGPNAIMFFKDGCLLTRHKDNGGWDSNGKYYHKAFRDPPVSDSGWQLSIILAMIISACETGEMRRTHFFPANIAGRLIQGEGSSISHNRFSFGEGISKKA